MSRSRCPECCHLSRTPVATGTTVRCPECQHVFRAGEPDQPPTYPVYRGVSNAGLPAATGRSRKAHLSTAREARLRDGKQPRFGDNRRFNAVCLIAVLGGLLYGVGVWFHGWLVVLDKTGEMVNQKRKSQAAIHATQKAQAAAAKARAAARELQKHDARFASLSAPQQTR
jgi:hypothetical protein